MGKQAYIDARVVLDESRDDRRQKIKRDSRKRPV